MCRERLVRIKFPAAMAACLSPGGHLAQLSDAAPSAAPLLPEVAASSASRSSSCAATSCADWVPKHCSDFPAEAGLLIGGKLAPTESLRNGGGAPPAPCPPAAWCDAVPLSPALESGQTAQTLLCASGLLARCYARPAAAGRGKGSSQTLQVGRVRLPLSSRLLPGRTLGNPHQPTYPSKPLEQALLPWLRCWLRHRCRPRRSLTSRRRSSRLLSPRHRRG